MGEAPSVALCEEAPPINGGSPHAARSLVDNFRERLFDRFMVFITRNTTCRTQNPDIQRAGRVGAAHGGAAGRQGEAGPGRTRRRRDGSPRKQQTL